MSSLQAVKVAEWEKNKALLPFGGFDTLAEYQYTRLCKSFSKIYISCKDSSNFSFHANFIEDEKTSSVFAPILGSISKFQKLNYNKSFVIRVDTPCVSINEILKIVNKDKKSNDAIIVKTISGIHSMIEIYHKILQDKFLHLLQSNNHKLGYLLKKFTHITHCV